MNSKSITRAKRGSLKFATLKVGQWFRAPARLAGYCGTYSRRMGRKFSYKTLDDGQIKVTRVA